MPPHRALPLLLPLLSGLPACDVVPAGAVTQCESVTVIPPVARTDILFVVDDSGSMREEQQNLADNFEAFIARLSASPFRNDFQIGITSTSVDLLLVGPDGTRQLRSIFGDGPNVRTPYPAGALLAVNPDTGAYLADGPRILQAGSPTLVTDFQRNVQVGTFGSGKEQGLRAATLALTERIADGTNAGFLRPGARLAVILVSDADDCSDPAGALPFTFDDTERCYTAESKARLAPVEDFVQVLRGPLAGEQREVAVAVIAGVDAVSKQPAVTCEGPEDAAARYRLLVDAFGEEGLIDDICNRSFRDTLEAIAGLLEPPQVVPVEPAPVDVRLLAVRVARADGTRTACGVAVEGTEGSGAADAVYRAPVEGASAQLSFQNACRLQKGDRVEVQLLCAG